MKTPNSIRIAASVALPSLHRRLVAGRYASSGHLVSGLTRVAVEGFPRSGNTWLVACLLAAGIPRYEVASHLHYAWHARLAADLGIPVFCPVRDPVDAVTSLCVRDPSIRPTLALRYYRAFYTQTLRVPGVHFVQFEELVGAPAVNNVRRMLRAGGLDIPWEPSAPMVEDFVREMARNEQRPTSDVARRIGLPDSARSEAKTQARKRVEEADRDLERASIVYDQLLNALAGRSV